MNECSLLAKTRTNKGASQTRIGSIKTLLDLEREIREYWELNVEARSDKDNVPSIN